MQPSEHRRPEQNLTRCAEPLYLHADTWARPQCLCSAAHGVLVRTGVTVCAARTVWHAAVAAQDVHVAQMHYSVGLQTVPLTRRRSASCEFDRYATPQLDVFAGGSSSVARPQTDDERSMRSKILQ